MRYFSGNNKILLFVGLLLALTLFIVGCGQKQTSQPTTPADTSKAGAETKPPETPKEKYKIGLVFALTGNAALAGTMERNAAILAIDEINAKGGIDGHLLEAVIHDTRSDATEAVRGSKKFGQDTSIVAILGGTHTGDAVAMIDPVMEAKIPTFTFVGGRQVVLPLNERQYIFNMVPQGDELAKEVASFATKRNINKVALIITNDAWGDFYAPTVKKHVEAAGKQLHIVEKMGKEDADVTGQMAKIKASGAEMLHVGPMLPAAAVALRSAKQVGLNLPTTILAANATPDLINLAGDAAEGAYLQGIKALAPEYLPDNDPQKKLILEHQKAYESRFPEKISMYTGASYDAIMMVAKALKEVGADRAKIRDYVETMGEYIGVQAIYRFSKDAHWIDETNVVPLLIKGGKWTYAD